MELDVHWCWAFGIVRTISRDKGVQCCGPAWAFDRWIATDFPPAGGPAVSSFAQAQFKYSLAWFQGAKAPWIKINVYGDGSLRLGVGMTCRTLAIVLLVLVVLFILYFVFTYFGTPSVQTKTVPG